MKSLILLEGHNDFIFLEEIIRNSPSHNIKFKHFRNDGNKTQKKSEETVLLRNFAQNNNSYNLLIKEELGKRIVLNLFNNLVINFLAINQGIYLTIILDHDNQNSETAILKLQDDLKAKTSNKLEFKYNNQNREILTGLNYQEYTLFQNSGKDFKNLTNFSIVSFNKSLEFEVSHFCDKPKNKLDEYDIRHFASKIKFDQLFPHHY